MPTHTLHMSAPRPAGSDVIVVRDHAELCLALHQLGAGHNCTIMVDLVERRQAERRQCVQPVRVERRRAQRRTGRAAHGAL